MNIAHIETQSYIYGPGCRFVIWVQGCSLHCKGCWNAEMWHFEAKKTYSVADLLAEIMLYQSDIEGITLLGGEPLDQYEEVLSLVKCAREKGFSVMLFTGYEMAEMETNFHSEILKYIDILISGRYELAKRTTKHQWIGSTNQAISFLSSRYQDYVLSNHNYVEITLEDSGQVTYLGFPNMELR